MSVFISIVSHGHGDLIKDLNVLNKLSEKFNVVVKSNIYDPVLEEYLESGDVYYLDDDLYYGMGFGENNNFIFNFCKNNLSMQSSDIFIVLNPDVLISSEAISDLVDNMVSQKDCLATINLYKDLNFQELDHCIRAFPSLGNFVSSFLGLGNQTLLNKIDLDDQCYVDWAAGSFLAFTAEHYKNISGFDESYFMYCEDIDICFRSAISSKPLKFYKNIRAVHLAKHNNRKIFSKHFLWHLRSVFRFLLSKSKPVKVKSQVSNA